MLQAAGPVSAAIDPWPEHPGKRATERFWLAYTPVWGGVCAAVMIGGLAERWGDLELMILGVGLGLGAFVGPLVFRAEEERGVPLHRTAALKMSVSVAAFAFLLNYYQTPFFWDVLHMHYGFAATITIENNPVFLYFLTIAYFATYCALLDVAWRAARGLLSSPHARVLAAGVVPFAVAGLETALNANPFTRSLFCYDDMTLALWFGTLVYGTTFCFVWPVWLHIDERTDRPRSWAWIAVAVAAAMFGDILALDLYRHLIAPHVTTVIEGADGLRDFGTSCLVPIE